MPRNTALTAQLAGDGHTEEDVIRDALERSGGCVARAARLLGYGAAVLGGHPRLALWHRLRKFGLGALPAEIRARRRAERVDEFFCACGARIKTGRRCQRCYYAELPERNRRRAAGMRGMGSMEDDSCPTG